ncbi:MAG: M48 family metalloprotease [Xanthomonadales bacterium]|nr:M48 family metalloprotease [Xanthomonadales bacterium]
MTWTLRATVALILPALLLMSGCATNPASGSAQVVLMSEEKEVELGKKLHPKVLAEFGIYPDPDLQSYVDRIGQELAKLSERPELDWHFTVLDDDVVNAFAMPGGYIYITRGILAHLNSEAELAAVLGHEIGHVTARHAIERDRNQKLLSALSAATSIASGTTMAGQATSLVGTAAISGFGRAQELEADRLGARYMASAGYPTDAVYTSVEILKRREQFEIERARAEGRKPRTPHGIFATHPDNDQRFEEAIEAASAYQSNPDATHRREEYLNRINGLRWGPKSVPGVVRNNYFYHSQFGIKMKFPEDWRVEGEAGQLAAVSPENDAAIQIFVVIPGRTMTPLDVIRRKLGLQNVKDAKETTIAGLPAVVATGDRYTGPFGPRPVRAAAIVDQRRRRAYVFAGTGRHDLSRLARDGDFIATIFTFDRMQPSEMDLGRPPVLKVVRAEDDTTMQQLAENSAVPVFAEQQIRLINGLYPRGEPEPGELIKTVD